MSYCSNCGAEIPAGAHFCPSCGTAVTGDGKPAETAQAAAPQSQGETVAASAAVLAQDMQLASLWRRFFAHLLDLVFAMVAYIVIGATIAARTGNTTENGFEMHGAPAAWTLLLTYLVVLFYFSILEAMPAGKTLGKMAAGIRVANENCGKASFGQAFMRNLLRLVDFIPFYLLGLVLALASERKQRLGDRVAHTLVLSTGASAGGRASGRKGDAKDGKKGGEKKYYHSIGVGSDIDV